VRPRNYCRAIQRVGHCLVDEAIAWRALELVVGAAAVRAREGHGIPLAEYDHEPGDGTGILLELQDESIGIWQVLLLGGGFFRRSTKSRRASMRPWHPSGRI
jgi:hypothetical protein